MHSLFAHAVDNRNKNMASVNKTMYNYNSMVEVGSRVPHFSMMEKYYEGMVIQVYIIFCDYNLVSLKIM